MKSASLWSNLHWPEWTAIVLAIAIGPAFLGIGYATGLVFRAAAGAYILCCVVVVPLLTVAGGRLKFLVWQLAIVSLSLTVVEDNLRLKAIHSGEIATLLCVLWSFGTLVSSPLPIYFLLRPMTARQRYIAGIVIAMAALALWLWIKTITR